MLALSALALLLPYVLAQSASQEQAEYNSRINTTNAMKGAMLSSIRTSWEQGTAAAAILENADPEYSVFGNRPFQSNGILPVQTLRLALSAAVRQTSDGRLSQNINDALDGAALDGASAGSAVLLGSYTEPSRKSFWQSAAAAQLNYVLNVAPRTSTGAISHRADSKEYWSDGVYVGFPFIAAYGAVTQNQTLLQIAYDQCRLYRNALLVQTANGPLWAHIYSDDTKSWIDEGVWATGNGWAAMGMLRIYTTIQKTPFASSMKAQSADLISWVKEILDGTFRAVTPSGLLPDYITGGASFTDSSSSAALASVAYRASTLRADLFGTNSNYTTIAATLRDAVLNGVDDLGVLDPVVNPLNTGAVGVLSTEGQAFALMMVAGWRDWIAGLQK